MSADSKKEFIKGFKQFDSLREFLPYIAQGLRDHYFTDPEGTRISPDYVYAEMRLEPRNKGLPIIQIQFTFEKLKLRIGDTRHNLPIDLACDILTAFEEAHDSFHEGLVHICTAIGRQCLGDIEDIKDFIAQHLPRN